MYNHTIERSLVCEYSFSVWKIATLMSSSCTNQTSSVANNLDRTALALVRTLGHTERTHFYNTIIFYILTTPFTWAIRPFHSCIPNIKDQLYLNRTFPDLTEFGTRFIHTTF